MRIHRILSLAAIVVAAPLVSAGAAPQLLGLMASNGAKPLTCADGECAAQFSTFCLQSLRSVPTSGTVYHPIGESDLTLVATAKDGSLRRLAAEDYVEIASMGGVASVRISVPEAVLDRVGAIAVAVEVGDHVTLAPAPVAGNPNPQTAEEIALATETLRIIGAWLVDRGGPQAVAARITSDMINSLPERGRVERAVVDSKWRQTLATHARKDEAGVQIAAEQFGYCRAHVDEGFMFSMRRCLEKRHDALMLNLNRSYWEVVGVGS